ncbi:MAG: gluconate 2-dehydrogenase subunit 3 family protein, partial [Verrucomicrobiaceae bacterium]
MGPQRFQMNQSPAPLAPMSPSSLTRREALRRILVASALAASLDITAFAIQDIRGIGADPNLLKKEMPWPRLLTEEEKRLVTVLGDLIIPADEFGPAASAVGVPDFIDEWVSAPYDQQKRDRETLRKGFTWLNEEANRRFKASFADASAEQQTALLEEIVAEGTQARKQALSFFRLFRDRVAGGYYSTPEGWRALGYMGNTPQIEFAGPPAEALK